MNLRPPVPTSDHSAIEQAGKQRRAALIPVVVGLAIVLGLAGFLTLNKTAQVYIRPYYTDQMSLPENNPDFDIENDDSSPILDFKSPLPGINNFLAIRSDDRVLTTEPAGLPAFGQAIDLDTQDPDDAGETDPKIDSSQIDLSKVRRLAGFVRTSGNVTDEYAFWEMDEANIQQIMDWYSKAAANLNFTLLKKPTPHTPHPRTPQLASAKATGETTSTGATPGENTSGAGQAKTFIFTRSSLPDGLPNSLLPGSDVLIIRALPVQDGRQVHVTLWHRSSSQESDR